MFLCSYPKSGRTWLRFLLTSYQLRLFDVDFHLTLQSFPALSPNVTVFSPVRLRSLPVDAPIHRLLGTHSEYPSLFRGLRKIVLRRDIRDILVSYYHQRVALGEFCGDLESFIWSPWGLRRAVRYHNRWSRALTRMRKDAVLELTYERLHADTMGCVVECLRFMNLDVRDSLVSEAMTYASADNMRKLEAKWGRTDFSVEQLERDETGFRVRRAQAGGYKAELSIETAARIGAILRNELVDCCGYEY